MFDRSDRKVWLAGAAGVALVVCGGAYEFAISPQLDAAGQLRADAASTQENAKVLEQKVAALRKKDAKIDAYLAALRRAIDALPSDSGLPAFTRQITGQARESSVAITGIQVGGITSLQQAAAPTTTTEDGSGDAGTAPAPAPTPATTDGSAGYGTAPETSTTAAPAGTYAIQVTVTSIGTLQHQLGFLKALQYEGSRSALVTSAQLGTDGGAESVDSRSDLTAQLVVFSAPQSAATIAQLQKSFRGRIGS